MSKLSEKILDRADQLLDEKNAFLDAQLEAMGRVDFHYQDQTTIFLLLKIAELEQTLKQ